MTAPVHPTSSASPHSAADSAPRGVSVVRPGNQFIRSLVSEFRKVTTLRSCIVWAILFTGCLYGMPFLVGMFGQGTVRLSPMDLVRGDVIFMMLAVIFGASSVGRDYAHSMHAHSFLTQRSRWQWLVARYVVVAAFTAAMFVMGAALSYVVTLIFPDLELSGEGWSSVGLVLFALPVFALIGAGASAVFRNRIAGIALPLVWFLVIENLLKLGGERISAAKLAYEWSPGHSIQTFHMAAWNEAKVDVGQSVAALVAWLVLWTVAGVIVNQKRDVR